MGATMMFSADYPFKKMEDAANWFDKTPLTNAQRLQIGRANVINLFKLNLQPGFGQRQHSLEPRNGKSVASSVIAWTARPEECSNATDRWYSHF